MTFPKSKKNTLKISFDYDGTVGDNPTIIELAKKLVEDGHDVWILTARSDGTEYNESKKVLIMNYDVYDTCDLIGIPHEKVIFTSFKLKVHKFKEEKFDLHFDDDEFEISQINKEFPDRNPAMFVGFNFPERLKELKDKFNEGFDEASDSKLREVDFNDVEKDLHHLMASRNNCIKIKNETKDEHEKAKALEMYHYFNKKIVKLLNLPIC